MSSLFKRLRSNSGDTERLSVNDWASMFSYNGNSYPVGGSVPIYSKTESIDNDFIGYVQGAYKECGPIFAVETARLTVFSEARFMIQSMNQGRPGDLYYDNQLSLLENPWPNGTTSDLLVRALQDADFAGNFYCVEEGLGPNRRLRRLRPDWVDILLTAPPATAVASDVAGYVYRPGGTDNRESWVVYPIDGSRGTVCHWTPLPDPEAQYRGMSWITPIIREVLSDKATTAHKLKYFSNAATPNLAVSFKETVTAEQFREFKQQMDAAHQGSSNAYKTLYLGGGADVSVIGANMQEMAFSEVQSMNEMRIAQAGRVPAMIAGFVEGMKGTALSERNMLAAKEMFGDMTLRPLWRSLCTSLTPLFNIRGEDRLWYDDRDISFLRQDRKMVADLENVQASTIGKLVQEGFTPDSVVQAVLEHDWRLLEHTGLYSVQLLPPNPEDPADANDPNTGPANKSDGKDSGSDDDSNSE